MPSRARAWMRDELILALDLYMRQGRNPGAAPAQELSDILRAMPVEQELTSNPKFRSPQSVTYKLQNFVALDPSIPTSGFSHGGRGDKEVWDEFAHDPLSLRDTAAAIVDNLDSLAPPEAEEVEESIAEAEEGKVLTRVHRMRERSDGLRRQKRKAVKKATGRLACEACEVDLEERYGVRASDFIECHHVVPLHTLDPGKKTRLDDLALLCPNCHRILHLRQPWLTVEEVRELVLSNGH